MPELPDVEAFKQYFDSTSLHKKIENIKVKNSEILGNVSAKKLEDKLKGRKFESTRRYGKYLFAKTEDNFWLIIHFGMTGKLKYFKDIEDEPSHSRMLLTFSNGFHLSFDNQRKLGKVDLAETVKDFVKEKNLGPDALEIDFDTFKNLVNKRRGTTKYTLMNQHIIAGVGNIYSDEILFQAGIKPTTKINQLTEGTLKKLFEEMKNVLNIAIDSKADPERLPEDYLIPHRTKGGQCPKGNSRLKKIKVSGRTTYYCPKHQK